MTGKLVPLRQSAASTQPAEVPDTALLAACVVGDGAALGALYDRHHAAVERFVGRLSYCNHDELADLVQSTFIEVRRSARSFKGKSSVRTWILSIAVNLARHHVRTDVRRRALLAEAARQAPPAPAEAPDEAAAHKQLLERLARALADLPAGLRETFVLCDLEEVPGGEAARALGVREGTLWWRLHEARRRLRAALEKERP